jgi:uncharacterized membrane protein YozB (DUF420 family)
VYIFLARNKIAELLKKLARCAENRTLLVSLFIETAISKGNFMNSTTTLIIYIVLMVPLMLLGFYFARRKMFSPHHKLVMTSVVILNWILIAIVMARSYALAVAPNIPEDIGQIGILLPTIHLITGAIAQLLGTYLVILMWTENTPLSWLAVVKTRNIKPLMRTTLALWLLTILLGFGIYAVWNAPAANAEDTPVVTEEATESADTEAVTTEEVASPEATEIAEPDATEDAPEATEASGD